MPEESIYPGEHNREKKPTGKIIEIDMNPMVDLAFLLLTFFMLTTTFNQPQAMELVMPAKDPLQKSEQQPVKASQALTLLLGEGDALYYYYGLPESAIPLLPDELPSKLERALRNRPGLVVIVKPHPESHFASIVEVLDALNVQGIPRYAIAGFEEADAALLKASEV